jgi:hypothetical protein
LLAPLGIAFGQSVRTRRREEEQAGKKTTATIKITFTEPPKNK